MSKQRCVDFVACRDPGCCGCCLPKSTGDAKRLRWTGIFILIIAILFFVLALFLPTTIKNVFISTLESSAIITPGNFAFETFSDNTEFPMKLEVYMYDITNADATLTGSQPELQEIGPFVYWVYRKIVDDYKFQDSDKTLTWKYYEHYQFDRDLSIKDDQDTIITQVNMPFIGVVSSFLGRGNSNQILEYFINLLIENGAYANERDMIYTTRSVREHMFGYDDDPFFVLLSSEEVGMLPNSHYSGIMTNYTSVDDTKTRLEYFDSITTGLNDRKIARHYTSYRNSKTIQNLDRTKCPWSDDSIDQCLVRGIDGGAIPPINDVNFPYKNSTDLHFDFFYPSLSRHINMVYEKMYTEESVNFYRFRFNPKEFQTQVQNPYNIPYGMDTEGVIEMAPALGGSPVKITRPRALGIVDPEFLSTVKTSYINDGKRDPADISKMDVFFDIEERTGSTLRFMSTSEMVVDIGPITFTWEDPPISIQSQINHQYDADPHKQPSPSCSFSPYAKNTASCLNENIIQKFVKRAGTLQTQMATQAIHTCNYLTGLNFKPIMHVPFFWANQTGGISDKDLVSLGATYRAVDKTITVLPIICFVVAGISALFGLFFIIRGAKYQHMIHTDGATLYESRQDGDLHDDQFDSHKQNYNETLDALDLDPIYSQRPSSDNRQIAQSSVYINQSSGNSYMPHRSVSQVSSTAQRDMKINRVTSMDRLVAPSSKPNHYGGVELKDPHANNKYH